MLFRSKSYPRYPCNPRLPFGLPASPPDGEPVYLERGNTHADWHRLSILATGPDTLVELQIAADHRDSGQHIWSIPNERRVLQRRSNDAVLDQIRFRGGEDELAVGDVHLPAAEVRRVNAVLHRLNNVFRRVLPGEHVSVGHTRHGDVLIALATAVAGVGNAHQARRQLVGEIGLEDAVLDEHRVLGLVAFVVHVERAATA